MFANFTITVAPPKRALAVPQDGVVREGDGTMTVWVTQAGANSRSASSKPGSRMMASPKSAKG